MLLIEESVLWAQSCDDMATNANDSKENFFNSGVIWLEDAKDSPLILGQLSLLRDLLI